MDDAAELFQKAGNSFKMAKNWTLAGKSFCQAAEIQLKQNTKHEAANMYNEAANSFKKASPEEALNCLNKSCEIYIDMVTSRTFINTQIKSRRNSLKVACHFTP